MARQSIEVRVENQLVRFVCSPPVDGEAVVKELDGQRTGDIIIKALESPRATIVIDSEGRIVVHGTHREEAARAAAKEVLLRIGRDDSGLVSEMGPLVASFDFGVNLDLSDVRKNLGSGTSQMDDRLGCLRIDDNRHEMELLVWPSGRSIAIDATHPNMVAMAAVHWLNRFRELKYVTE